MSASIVADKDTQIEAGVRAYLERCKSPLQSSVPAFLDTMKNELGWTDLELIQLQSRVICVLTARLVPVRHRQLHEE